MKDENAVTSVYATAHLNRKMSREEATELTAQRGKGQLRYGL
jgi:hypothetical protein